MIDNQYSSSLEDEDLFFFNIKKDHRLGDGSDKVNKLFYFLNNKNTNTNIIKYHTHIMMTSRAMMKKSENIGVFHIDGTYKLIKNRFPVMGNLKISLLILCIYLIKKKLVLGITDIAGEFHPIAYCVTSHEKEEDFIEFFSGVKKLATQMEIELEPEFLMMDASDATYNAASKIFPNTTVLMCYFHLMQNVLKNCRSLFKTEKEFDSFNDALYELHVSRSETEYSARLVSFQEKYNNKNNRKAYDYMIKQWISSRFNKWQIFHSPPGFANTNSNIESFNKQIKGFTHKKKLTVFGMIDKCCEMVHYYSTEQAGRFNEYPKFKTKLNDAALKLDKSLFKKISYLKYGFKNWTINIKEKCCSCRGFLKCAICPHSLAFSHLKNLDWFGPKYTSRLNEFVFKNKTGRKKGHRYKKASSALEIVSD